MKQVRVPSENFLPLDGVQLVSTDVFDSLLIRDATSSRARIMAAERQFADRLCDLGHHLDLDTLAAARFRAERLAFRALNVGGGSGEVRIRDVVARQLQLLGLPEDLIDLRIGMEVEIEADCLKPNLKLASALQQCRDSGLRVIAVSDTILDAASVGALIEKVAGESPVDQIYTSADAGQSKRHGGLFEHIMSVEGVGGEVILHIGDDARADVSVPRKFGIRRFPLPEPRVRRFFSRADGALTEQRRMYRRRNRVLRMEEPTVGDATAFGRHILGPVAVELCVLFWLYASEACRNDKTVLLFCARGGVGIRAIFERVLERFSLPLAAGRENLMVSRVVAARAAVFARNKAAIDELNREFRSGNLAAAAAALAGRVLPLGREWDRSFDARTFMDLLDSEQGGAVQREIKALSELFEHHLDEVAQGSERLLLCDTGLYGSTQRLLETGLPARRFESLLMARANYKQFSTSHFARATGVTVQQDYYSSLKIESCVLRYWQLIEKLFEPAIPSTKTFTRDSDGTVRGNCGDIRYGAFDVGKDNPLLAGALEYVDALPQTGGGIQAMLDAEQAWRRLKRAIVWPREEDIQCIGLGKRSIDFGRDGHVSIIASAQDKQFFERLRAIPGSLWREAAIASQFQNMRAPLLALLETAHFARSILKAAPASRSSKPQKSASATTSKPD